MNARPRLIAASALAIALIAVGASHAADAMPHDAMAADSTATECFEKAEMEADVAMRDTKVAACEEMYPGTMMGDAMAPADAMMSGDAMMAGDQ